MVMAAIEEELSLDHFQFALLNLHLLGCKTSIGT